MRDIEVGSPGQEKVVPFPCYVPHTTDSARCRYRGRGTHTHARKRMMPLIDREVRGSSGNYIGKE